MNQYNIILQRELNKLDIIATEDQIDLLIKFVDLMYKWNKTYNLTSVRDKEEMLYKHIIDSVAVSRYIQGSNFIDVGTGPGLPGIPLAILHKDKNFYLLDSQTKRINFIRHVKRELNIQNIVPCLGRCEEFRDKNKELIFDGIISRAFASLKDMIFLCKNLVTKETKFLALKGIISDEELKEVDNKFDITDIIKLNVPQNLGSRHLIIIKNKG